MSEDIVLKNEFGLQLYSKRPSFVLPYKALTLDIRKVRTIEDAKLMMTKIQRSSLYYSTSSIINSDAVVGDVGDSFNIKTCYTFMNSELKIPQRAIAVRTMFDSILCHFSMSSSGSFWVNDLAMFAIASWYYTHNILNDQRLLTFLYLLYVADNKSMYAPSSHHVNAHIIAELILGSNTDSLVDLLENEQLILPKEFIDDVRTSIIQYDTDDKHNRFKQYIKMRTVCQY